MAYVTSGNVTGVNYNIFGSNLFGQKEVLETTPTEEGGYYLLLDEGFDRKPTKDDTFGYTVTHTSIEGAWDRKRYDSASSDTSDYNAPFTLTSEGSGVTPQRFYYGASAEGATREHSSWNTNIPIFRADDTEGIEKYRATGDDSSALNYDDLHEAKYHFTLNNDNNLITLNYTIDGGDVPMSRISVQFTNSLFGSFEWNESSFQVPWSYISEKMSATLLKTMNVIIRGYREDESQAFELSAECKRKLAVLGVFGGELECVAIVGEDNGHTLNCSTNGSFEDESKEGEDEDTDVIPNTNDPTEFTGLTSLTTTYRMNSEGLRILGNQIWTNSIFDNLKNLNNSPLENIVSCKYMPNIIQGTASPVQIGNITFSGVNGEKLNNTTVNRINYGTVRIEKPNVPFEFMCYEPYTQVSLYLPLLGMVELSARDVVGKNVTIKYAFDVVVGTFGATVEVGDKLIYSGGGTAGIDVPITASNRSQFETAIAKAGIDVGLTALTGGATASTLASDISSIAQFQNHSSRFGSASSQVATFLDTSPFYILRYPIVADDMELFGHTHGYLLMKDKKLSDVEGFTVCDNIDLSGLYCTEYEREQIKELLMSGVYFPVKK